MCQFGLLGHPLGHSFSREFHNHRFAELKVNARYDNYDLDDIAAFPDLLREHPDLSGLNVTIPYKQQVMAYLDELDPLAARIGAVNVVKIRRLTDGAEACNTKVPGFYLKGFNSDIVGFCDSLRPMLVAAGLDAVQAGKESRKALVLGTGGASKAVYEGLKDLGFEPVWVSRTPAPGRLTYGDLTSEVMASHRVIVNCTPLGMFPNVDTCPDLPYALLTPSHVCFDCVYNPAETLFMKKAAERGAAVKCGYDMLVGQAIESYRIWTGI